MDRRQQQRLTLLLVLADLLATTAAWLGGYAVRFGLWDAPGGVPRLQSVLEALPKVLLLSLVAYRLAGMYQVLRLRRWRNELPAVLLGTGLLFLLLITVTFYQRHRYESRLALGLFLVLCGPFVLLARRVVWWLVCRTRPGGLRVVLVGSGRPVRRVVQTLKEQPWLGVELLGYVDHQPHAQESLPYLGTLEQLPELVEKHLVDRVLVALPFHRYGEMPAIYETLSQLLVEVSLVPDLHLLAGMRIRTAELDGLTVLSLRENPHFGWQQAAKRALDLVLGTLALVLLSPVMLALAVAIKLTSPGPVFYRQLRMGLGGKPFWMWKFRSMRVDAEAESGPRWASKDDPRCTAVGRFMRRWSLDELPQLFNVLAGQMSLVGPRPERGVFVERFRRQVPNYAQRHQVKAGITGWAQVHGWRGDTSLRRRVQYDLYYITHWSLWLDLKILWLTLLRGFRHPNAY